jgi:hypothetical protein
MCFFFALCAAFLRLKLARKAAGPQQLILLTTKLRRGEWVLAKSSKTSMVNKSYTTKG